MSETTVSEETLSEEIVLTVPPAGPDEPGSTPGGTPPGDTPPGKADKRGIGAIGWIALAWMIFIVVVAIVGPLLAADTSFELDPDGCGDGSGLPIYDPIKCADIDNRFVHVFGVDGNGRDVLSQVVFGTRTSLIISFSSIGIAIVVGAFFGMVAGYFGRLWGSVIGSAFDVMLAFPQLVLALTIVTFVGAKESTRVPSIILALGIVATPVLGRITRASALAWSNREFVMASKALGAKDGRIMLREVFPNVVPALLSIAFLAVAVVIVAEGGLSVLGLGVPSTQVSWGSVLATGGGDLANLSHMVYASSAAILLTVMSLNILGDAVRRKFDVRESVL